MKAIYQKPIVEVVTLEVTEGIMIVSTGGAPTNPGKGSSSGSQKEDFWGI